MIEVLLAIVAALYTARFVVREASRTDPPSAHARSARAPSPAPPGVAGNGPPPPAPTFEPVREAAARASIDLLPRAESRLGVPTPHPDPDRFIQTEVAVPEGRRQTTGAFVRLAVALLLLGTLLAVSIVGVARALAFLLQKLAGG